MVDQKQHSIIGRLARFSGRFSGRLIARLTAFSLTAFILLIIAVQGLVIWLNTSNGSAWIEARANDMLEPAGYTLTLKNFSLTKFIGIKAKTFELSQNGTRIISARNLGVLVNPIPVAAKRLSISLDADSFEVLAAPTASDKVQDPAPSAPFNPIAKPDIFFDAISVSLDMKVLKLAEGVAGKPLATRLTIDQMIDLSADDINIRGGLNTAQTNEDFAHILPRHIKNNMRFDVSTQSIAIDRVNVLNDIYTIDLGGSYGLKGGDITANVKMNYTLPSTQAVTLTSNFNGTSQNLAGGIKLESIYQDYVFDMGADVTLTDQNIALSNINSTSPDIDLKGDVTYALESTLAEGFVTADIAKLSRFAPLLGRSDLRGGVYLTADIVNKDGVQGLEANADITGLNVQGTSIETAKLKAVIDNITALDTFTVNGSMTNANANGVLIQAIDLALKPVNDKANIKLSGKGFRYQPFTFSAEADIAPSGPLNIDLKQLRFAPKDGAIEGVGQLTADGVNLKITGQGLTAKTMPFVELGTIPAKLSSLLITLDGPLASPRLSAEANITASTDADQYAEIDFNTTYQNGMLTASMQGRGKGVDELAANGRLPFTLSLSPFVAKVPEGQILDAQFTANTRLAAIAPYVLDENADLKGALSGKGTLRGQLSDINVNGDISLKDGLFTDRVNGFAFKNIAADVRLENRVMRTLSLTAENADGEGRISLEGSGDLNNLAWPDITAKMLVDNLTVVDNQQYDARINADVDLKTTRDGYMISGTVKPLEVNIQIPNEIDPAVAQLNVIKDEDAEKGDNILTKFGLDVTLNAEDKVFVAGRGLTSELSGDLKITGTLAAPLVNGNMETVRGRYEEFGRRFNLKRTVLRFQGEVPPSPYLDVEAEADIDDVTAKILISGSVENPKIKLASVPALPDDEVLSFILFGKNIQQISPFQAIQLANTLRKFSGIGGGGPDMFQQLRNATGLDDIRIGADAEGGATVGAGKYISEKVYLQVEKGASETSGAASLEVELTPNITLESEAKQNGDTGAGVFWEWDY